LFVVDKIVSGALNMKKKYGCVQLSGCLSLELKMRVQGGAAA
jgi:hypothetical protein